MLTKPRLGTIVYASPTCQHFSDAEGLGTSNRHAMKDEDYLGLSVERAAERPPSPLYCQTPSLRRHMAGMTGLSAEVPPCA